MPKSNITADERQALDELSKDDSIYVLPADKGRAVCVMDRSDYEHKIDELLSDSKTYEKLKSDPTPAYSSKAKKVLKNIENSGAISREEYLKLYPTACVPPKFYGLPKIHKPGTPLRPIVATRGSITYETAKFVTTIISPLVGKTPYHIKHSADLKDKLTPIQL